MVSIYEQQLPISSPRPVIAETGTNLISPAQSLQDRLRHFPDEIYDLSPHTHLYKLLAVLLGDAGMGGIRKRTMMARIQSSVSGTNWFDLDRFWGGLFGLTRRSDEALPIDPYSQVATPSTWHQVESADGSYRSRILQFARAISYGPTATGIELMAEAIIQADVDVEEEWESADDLVTTYDDLEAVGTYDDLEAVGTYADLEALGGAASTVGRHSFIVRPRRPITEEERWDLVRILHVMKPAASTIRVVPAATTASTEVVINKIDSDSYLWEIGSITTVRTDGANIYSDVPDDEDEVADIEQPRPPWSANQGEEWSYIGDVATVVAYGEITADTVERPNWERITLASGEARDYLPDHGLRPLPEIAAARLISDGVAVAHPYSGPRRLPDPARPPTGFTGASLAELTKLYLDTIPLDNIGEVDLTKLATEWRKNRAERFWSTSPRSFSDPRWEVLELRLRLPRRVNRISCEVAKFPSVVEIQYRDLSLDDWVTISTTRITSSSPEVFLARTDRQTLHPQHGWVDHWQRIEQPITPVRGQAFRVRIQRLATGRHPVDGNGNPINYSVAVRDFDLGYSITSLDDIPNQLLSPEEIESSIDAVGSRVSFRFTKYDGASLRAGGSWLSEPQPIPGSVVNLYLDLRDRYGSGQVIDQLWLDPITPGVPFNLYYSNDTLSQQDFAGVDELIPFSIHGFVDPVQSSGFQFSDLGASGIEINNSSIHFESSRSWWAGFLIQPLTDSTVSDAPIWRFEENGLFLHQGGVEFRGINGEVVRVDSPWLVNTRLAIFIRYEPTSRTITLRVAVSGGTDTTTTGVMGETTLNLYPETMCIGGKVGDAPSGFLLRSAVLKVADDGDDDDWVARPESYSSKPLFPTQEDLTYNSILRIDPLYFNDDVGGVVGGPPDFWASLSWTPVVGDFTLHRGTVGIAPIKPRFLKLEFSNLAVRPYETKAPVSRPIKLFPPAAHASISPEADVHAAWPGLQTAMGLLSPLRTDVIPEVAFTGIPPTTAMYPSDLSSISTFRTISWAYGFMPWQIGAQRPRFVDEGVHSYVHQVVPHNAKLAWHVGLKGIGCFNTKNNSRVSPEAFVERFLDDSSIESSDWVMVDGGVTTGIGTSTTVTSKTFQTRNNIIGIQWATSQTEPIQVLPDDNFRDPALGSYDWDNLNRWHIYGDSTVAYLPHDHSVLVIRDIPTDIASIEDFGIMIDPVHPVQSFYRSGMTGSIDDGGIESPLVVVSPQGYLHAAVRIVGVMNTNQPVWLQIVGSDGSVVAEESRVVRAGEVVEWTTSSRLGGAYGVAVPIWDPERTIIDSPLHPTGLGYDPLVDEAGGLAGEPTRIFKVRVIQKTATADAWVVQRCSLFDDSLLWEFSNDGGASWVKAPSATRNNAVGLVSFATPTASLKWRVTGYRRGLYVSSLQIRPIYDRVTTARLSVPWRGANVSAYDAFPPIQEDPEFSAWTKPIPRWWYASGLRHEQDPFLYGQPTSNEYSLFYTVGVTEASDSADSFAVENMHFFRGATETDPGSESYGRVLTVTQRGVAEETEDPETYETRFI